LDRGGEEQQNPRVDGERRQEPEHERVRDAHGRHDRPQNGIQYADQAPHDERSLEALDANSRKQDGRDPHCRRRYQQ
jgi:hypothetical protein